MLENDCSEICLAISREIPLESFSSSTLIPVIPTEIARNFPWDSPKIYSRNSSANSSTDFSSCVLEKSSVGFKILETYKSLFRSSKETSA